MPKYGAQYAVFAKITKEAAGALPQYSAGRQLGYLNAVNITYNIPSADAYGDNMLAVRISQFVSATVDMTNVDASLQDQAELYGASIDNNELGYGADDVAPFIGFGFIANLLESTTKKKYWEAHFFPKAQAVRTNDNNATKADSISLQLPSMQLTIYPPKHGKYEYVERFESEEAALGYIQNKLNIAEWHRVSVGVSGGGAGKSVEPDGMFYAAKNKSVVLNITGTPTKLYDNGEEKTTSISDGVYTIADITADHDIAIIFAI